MYTVKELIEKLQAFPQNLPVMYVSAEGREGEYIPVFRVDTGHLSNQNTDGDPDFYWNPDEKDGNPIGEILLLNP